MFNGLISLQEEPDPSYKSGQATKRALIILFDQQHPDNLSLRPSKSQYSKRLRNDADNDELEISKKHSPNSQSIPSAFLVHQRYRHNPVVSVDRFLADYRPSVITAAQASWIQVENIARPIPQASPFNVEEYVSILDAVASKILPQKKISKHDKDFAINEILQRATACGETTGKWMLNPKNATVEGRLGCSAKVSTRNMEQQDHDYLICVYCHDFNDTDDVERVLKELKKMGLVVRNGFKPDVFTRLGIYTRNEWRLKPTIRHDILEKMDSDQWIHALKACRTYNYSFNPLKIPALDDMTGVKLTERADNDSDVINSGYEIQ
ncbi:hypothetical protein HK100_011922 [Physocladia obscura]|uniref:Uncharacterized protein n=1 Tax=Physocladia obscura TaxID=109957 RepID=A0AAD5T3E2_9FUNG|nr:hypothetical protein HK100_011922 [Physocladia obscura]